MSSTGIARIDKAELQFFSRGWKSLRRHPRCRVRQGIPFVVVALGFDVPGGRHFLGPHVVPAGCGKRCRVCAQVPDFPAECVNLVAQGRQLPTLACAARKKDDQTDQDRQRHQYGQSDYFLHAASRMLWPGRTVRFWVNIAWTDTAGKARRRNADNKKKRKGYPFRFFLLSAFRLLALPAVSVHAMLTQNRTVRPGHSIREAAWRK